MSPVDAIVAEFIVRGVEKYESNFDRATAAHERYYKSTAKLKTQTFDLNAEGQKYKAGADKIAQGEEQLAQRVTRSRKARADRTIAQDEREVVSAKRTAKAKADVEIAEAQRSARLRAAVEKGLASQRAANASASAAFVAGRTVPGDAALESAQREFFGRTRVPREGAAQAAAQAGAEREINRLALHRYDLQQRLNAASGRQRVELERQIAFLARINTYKAAGLTRDEAILRAQREMAAVEALRARNASMLPRISGLNGAGTAISGALGRIDIHDSPGAVCLIHRFPSLGDGSVVGWGSSATS